MSYNFDAELQKKMFNHKISYFDKPFTEKIGWKFKYGPNRREFIYVGSKDGDHKHGIDFKEMAQINNFEKALELFLTRKNKGVTNEL